MTRAEAIASGDRPAMRPRLRWSAGAVIAALATVGATGVGASGGGVDRGGEVIRYRTVTVEAAEIDHGDPGPSLGDQYIFSDALRRRGRTIGHNGGICMLSSLERGEYLCVGHAQVTGNGTIAGRFFLRPEGSSTKVRIAVTGGTGDYRGASGAGTAVLLSGSVAKVTLRLR